MGNIITESNEQALINTVYFDVSGEAGTDYPVGTRQHPVNNGPDLRAILAARGLTIVVLLSDFTVDAAMSTGLVYAAENRAYGITLHSGGNIGINSTLSNLKIDGTVLGCYWYNCFFQNSNGDQTSGYFYDCEVAAPILGGSTVFTNCKFDWGIDANGHSFVVINGQGNLIIRTVTAAAMCIVEFNGYVLTITNTCTNGQIDVYG
jgi:hypothetical protein